MRNPVIYILMLFSLSTIFPATAQAAAAKESTADKLVIGTKETPPFAMKSSDGHWHGLSIDLWRQIAEDLAVPYEFEERDISGLLQGVEDGSLDAAVAALTITSEREEKLDFTHPFHTSGLGIAVQTDDRGGWFRAVERIFSPAFFKVVGALSLVLLIFGGLLWLFERKKNPEQFGGSPLQGIGAGFWWSAVTMTTVGYGDKAPTTLGGRLVAMVWMFAAIIIISSFTAAFTSILTLSSLESRIRGPEDLGKVRVASVPASTSAAYLEANRIYFSSYPNPKAAMEALEAREVDAVVYDAPILRYLCGEVAGGTLLVLPSVFDRQDYGIALPTGSALREPLNRALLERVTSSWWNDTLNRYLGTQK